MKKPHPHYGYHPGGQPPWPSAFMRPDRPVVVTKACPKCGTDKPLSAFGKDKRRTCTACRGAADRERAKRVDLAPRRYVPISRVHTGAYSKA